MTTAITRTLARLGSLFVLPASAHCDTEDGPAVTDGRRALHTGNVNHALKWVSPDREAELRDLFDRAIRVRTSSRESTDLVDRLFLETLVRVHRAGEGEGFTGIQPAGTAVAPEVLAAERAILEGSIQPLEGVTDESRRPELRRLLDEALARKGHDVDDLVSARDYLDAYVAFVKYAEGGHAHGHHHAH